MRTLSSCLIVALLFAAPVFGQQPPAAKPPKPAEKPKVDADSLEAAIADAMKHNPDIRAAEAKVREAEIHLNKVKSEVMVAIATQRELVKVSKETHRLNEEVFAAKKQIHEKHECSYLELVTSQIELQRSKAAVAELEAALHKLIGRVPGMNLLGASLKTDPNWSTNEGNFSLNASPTWQNAWQNDTGFLFDYGVNRGTFTPLPMANSTYNPVGPVSPAGSNSSMMDKIRLTLDATVKIDKESTGPIEKFLEVMLKQGDRSIPFRSLVKNDKVSTNVVLSPGELPVGAWIVAIEDYLADQPQTVRFYVREYGILVTTADRAPKDAIPVSEFWRRSKAVEKPKEEKPKEEKK